MTKHREETPAVETREERIQALMDSFVRRLLFAV
jgi:hypothetical protein